MVAAAARNRAAPAAYAIFRRGGGGPGGGAVLLARRLNTGFWDGAYSLPAGHVEAGELPALALAREMREELGVAVDPAALSLRHAMYRAARDETGDRLDLFFAVGAWSGEPANLEPHKCDDLGWFAEAAYPRAMVPHVRAALSLAAAGVPYSELGAADRDPRAPGPPPA